VSVKFWTKVCSKNSNPLIELGNSKSSISLMYTFKIEEFNNVLISIYLWSVGQSSSMSFDSFAYLFQLLVSIILFYYTCFYTNTHVKACALAFSST